MGLYAVLDCAHSDMGKAWIPGMIITSNKRIALKPVGIVLRDGMVVGDWGITSIADSPRGATLFARSHADVWELIRAGRGRAKYWRKRYVAYEIDGRAIKSAKDIFSSVDPLEGLEDLKTWRDWAWDNKANVSSLTGTANSVWRGTLDDGHRLMVASGRLEVPTSKLFLGGRQEVQRGVYDSGSLWDIRGAYPAAMGALMVGAVYRRRGIGRIVANPSDVAHIGFAHARVAVRKTFWGAIPLRVGKRTKFPIDDMVEGIYDFEELRAAHKIGLNIFIVEAWIARGVRFPWRRWSKVIEEGRELPGLAGRLVKASSNSLWGSFAISGSGRWVSYVEGKMILEDTAPPFKRKNSEVLAAHVSSFIRGRLFLEALYLNRQGVLAAHTDGCIFADGSHPVSMGDYPQDGLGSWQYKKKIEDVVLLGPATYRYTNAAGELRYSMPGTPTDHRAAAFSLLLKGEVQEKASKIAERVAFSAR